MTSRNQSLDVLRGSAWFTALILGCVWAWISRFAINPDGVSYLDIGDAWWRGDWRHAANPYWSPMYSWILGGVLKVFHPSIRWEYPVVHLANFLIYIAALVCFEFLLKEAGIAEWIRPIAYALFIFASLVLIGIQSVSPDMLVSGFVYLIAALALRVKREPSALNHALLGSALGFAYLAKTIMLPIGILFLLTLYRSVPLKRWVASASIFAVIAAPWIAVCSQAKHRITIGESGRWNYLVFVNNVSPFFPEQSPNLKKLAEKPLTFDLSAAPKGTYPAWIDPSYWQDGIKPQLSLPGIGSRLGTAAFIFAVLLLHPKMALFMTISICAAMIAGFSKAPIIFRALLVPCSLAILAYAPLLIESRYIAPFLVIIWLAALSALTVKKWLAVFITAAGLAVTVWDIQIVREFVQRSSFSTAAACEFERNIGNGKTIALISTEEWMRTAGQGSFIARLNRNNIAAEVTEPDSFLASNHEMLLSIFRQRGITAALLYSDRDPGANWVQISPKYYARAL